MGKWQKVFLTGALAILVVVGIFYMYRDWKEARDFVAQDFNTFLEVPRSDREIANYTKLMERAYREDIYGGATPEETLQLFTDALKAGDTELAAKYFVVEKQVERKEILENWEIKDRLEIIAKSLEHYGDTAYPLDNTAQMDVVAEGNVGITVFFIKNPQTNKWKIESL